MASKEKLQMKIADPQTVVHTVSLRLLFDVIYIKSGSRHTPIDS